MRKNLRSILLTICMVLAMLPTAALAKEPEATAGRQPRFSCVCCKRQSWWMCAPRR